MDDTAANRDALVTLLRYVNHEVAEAGDGSAALAYTRANRPDLVISDVMMPVMDGFEFVRQVRADSEIANTVVMFCSAHYTEHEAGNLAHECGVARILPKPWEPETILGAVEECLREKPVFTPPALDEKFDRQHLRLLTDKLSIQTDELATYVMDLAERRKSEEHVQLLRSLVEVAREYAIFIVNTDGIILTWNEGGTRITGFTASEIVGRHISTFFPAGDVATGRPQEKMAIVQAQGRLYEEVWRIRKDGSGFWASVLVTALRNPDGTLRGYSIILHDVTARKNAETALKESENRLRQIADAMPQIVWTAAPDGHIDYFNQRWYDFTGLSGVHDSEETLRAILHRDDIAHYFESWRAAFGSGHAFEIETRLLDQESKGWRWHLGRAVPLYAADGSIEKWIGTFTDIDDHKRLSEELERRVAERTAELERSLVEKTTLLKEVHHRVNNNLQVISSFLAMQLDAIEDTVAAAPLREAQQRVLAMSLIHEQLYQSPTLSLLEFGDYIGQLSSGLFAAYCVQPDRIGLELDVEPVFLTIDHAIPCGLILNELISNSLKHAFPGDRSGRIRVGFHQVQGTEPGVVRAELSVSDDGIGLPPGFRLEGSSSMGLQVVSALLRQLGAQVQIIGEGGSSFVFQWDLEREEPSAAVAGEGR